jgi:hypothetical protein
MKGAVFLPRALAALRRPPVTVLPFKAAFLSTPSRMRLLIPASSRLGNLLLIRAATPAT